MHRRSNGPVILHDVMAWHGMTWHDDDDDDDDDDKLSSWRRRRQLFWQEATRMKYVRQQWRGEPVQRRHAYKRRLQTTQTLQSFGVPRRRRPSAAASHRLPQSTRRSTNAQGSGDSHTDAIRRLSCWSTPICRNVASVAAIHMPRPGRPHGDATAVTLSEPVRRLGGT